MRARVNPRVRLGEGVALEKTWIFILIGVIVAFGFDEVVGGSVIEDLCAIGEGLGHLDEVTISVEFWPIS